MRHHVCSIKPAISHISPTWRGTELKLTGTGSCKLDLSPPAKLVSRRKVLHIAGGHCYRRFERGSILPPYILDVRLCQPSIFTILLLPMDKPAFEDIDLLLLTLFRTQRSLSLPRVAEGGCWATLLAQSTMEYNFFFVFERPD